ncbi:Oxygen-dependent choline dehydrogenase [Colletotrichum sp. SAR 10_65]|nr:Oxygen-dependent choline dehydrogenase [Colletotrichum sp. SAR 10_65]KAJ4999545.1 Oxygen-dependent choline dehydrogenase [Colletotrichum sp. SAR 10_66]
MMKLFSFASILLFSSSVTGSSFNESAYDYVVVGSGPGGGTLAASLAREGHSVFLIEAGGNMGDNNLQRIPALADVNSEHPEMSWQFFVSHYQNETQARRDRYFTYRLSNGTLWYGIDAPKDASPLATRILMMKSGSGLKACGVEYMVGEGLYEADRRYDPSIEPQLRTVRAKKEVIISGGAFNTPQILKLSGIGPRQELEKFGIPVAVELPAVGGFLQDNYEAGINVRSNIAWENSPFAECTSDSPENDPCLAQWEAGYGAYGEAAAPIFMLYRSNHSRNADSDLILFGGAGGVFDGHYPGFSEISWPPTSFFWAAAKMQNGNPTGTVRLRSSNPRETPEINFNFYQEDSDVDIAALSEGLNHLMSIMNATGEPYQPFEVIDPPADRSLEQHIRDHTFSHHAVGSCRMGKSISDSCVDSKFRVHGVQGLRVVDGSVFPRVPGGFPIGATYAASRKAFHDIANDSDK